MRRVAVRLLSFATFRFRQNFRERTRSGPSSYDSSNRQDSHDVLPSAAAWFVVLQSDWASAAAHWVADRGDACPGDFPEPISHAGPDPFDPNSTSPIRNFPFPVSHGEHRIP